MTIAVKPTPTHPAYPTHNSDTEVWFTQVVERIQKVDADTIRLYSRQFPLDSLYDTGTAEIEIESEFYPALNGTQTVTSAGSDGDGFYLEFDPTTMDPNLVTGFNDGDGTLYGVTTWSQIMMAPTYVQLDADAASGVTIEVYARIHSAATWALIGTFVEGTDTFPVQIMFDEPMNQVQARADNPDVWESYAQRSGLK